jgi:SGT1 protein
LFIHLFASPLTDKLPAHLYGITYFGDNIQDEWFIVSLLFHLSREIAGLIIRTCDSDGEFLLIEAAEHLPQWASPETCEQRVSLTINRFAIGDLNNENIVDESLHG